MSRWSQRSGNLLHRPPHGQPRGFQNVPAVDLEGVGGAHGPGSRRVPGCVAASTSRRSGSRRLLSSRPRMGRSRIEHHRRGEHRTEQRSPAGFVDAGNGAVAGAAQARSWRLVGMQK